MTEGLVLVQDVTEREQLLQHSVQTEQLGALGEMAAGIAHNFNNLMTVILGCSELIAMSKNNPDAIREESQLILDTVYRASDIVHRIQEFTRFDDSLPASESLDLNRVVEEGVAVSRPKWKDVVEMTGRQIEIVTRLQPGVMVQGQARELIDVIASLIFNAVDAMPDGGTLTITTQHHPPGDKATRRQGDKATEGIPPSPLSPPPPIGDGPGREEVLSPSPPLPLSPSGKGGVEVVVADTGVGMTEEVRRRCFEPFFTTKGPQIGRGLGLSTAYGIVARHGGEIVVESVLYHGTTFTIKLPAAQQ